MAEKLNKTSKKKLDESRDDCLRFARAIIARWRRSSNRFGYGYNHQSEEYAKFAQALLKLRERDSIAALLEAVAERDETIPLKSFIVAAGREFGWDAFAAELKHFFRPPPTDRRNRHHYPAIRDYEWLSAICRDDSAMRDAPALINELCEIAVKRFRERSSGTNTHDGRVGFQRASNEEKSLPHLLKALVAADRDEDLKRVIDLVDEHPQDYRFDQCIAPTLKTLIPWTHNELGKLCPPLESWLADVRGKLERATGAPPAPPADWARPAEVKCSCEYCAKLNAFLADPESEVGLIPASDQLRHHLTVAIHNHRCDVTEGLERKGRPYSLRLTKTTGSFERAVKRFEADRKLLDELPAAGTASTTAP